MTEAANGRLRNLLQSASRPVPASIAMGILNFAACYFRSFAFPNVPFVVWGDQIGYFNAGSRIAAGQLPYRDYFQILPVGTDLTYAFLIKWFGFQLWIPNFVMACLIATAAILITLISLRILRGSVVFLPGLLLAGLILPVAADATHHWFSTIAVLAAVLVLMDGTTLPRVAAAGALCGLAACFTQTKGALGLAALGLYLAVGLRQRAPLATERWKAGFLLCGGAAAVFALVNAYFIGAAGFRQWLFCVVTYPARYYSVPSLNNWHALIYEFRAPHGTSNWMSLIFMYATVPLVYIVFAAVARRQWGPGSDESRRRVMLVALAGFAMFIGIASEPSGKRLATVTPLALVLLAWLLDRPGKVADYSKKVLAVIAILLAVVPPVRLQARQHPYLELPAGRAAFFDPAQSQEYRWLLDHTRPGQYFYGMPPYFSAFHLVNPAAIEGFHPSDYTRPEQVAALVEALKTHPVPLMVLRQSRSYLFVPDSEQNHLGPFRDYVSRNYRMAKTFPSGDEMWEKVETPDKSFSSHGEGTP
jgi:hypothetical protein